MKKITLLSTMLVSAFVLAQVPVNDLIGDAIDIDQFEQPYVDMGVNPADGTSKTDDTTDCNLNQGAPPFVWYKFTATLDGTLEITYSDTSNTPGAPVYSSFNGEDATAADLIFEMNNGNNTCGPSNSTTVSTVTGTTYYVAVTNGGAFDVTLDISTSILSSNEFSLDQSLSLYPNPASDIVTINKASDISIDSVSIYDTLGKLTSLQLVNGQVNISALTSGVYFMNINTSRGTLTQKIIKK